MSGPASKSTWTDERQNTGSAGGWATTRGAGGTAALQPLKTLAMHQRSDHRGMATASRCFFLPPHTRRIVAKVVACRQQPTNALHVHSTPTARPQSTVAGPQRPLAHIILNLGRVLAGRHELEVGVGDTGVVALSGRDGVVPVVQVARLNAFRRKRCTPEGEISVLTTSAHAMHEDQGVHAPPDPLHTPYVRYRTDNVLHFWTERKRARPLSVLPLCSLVRPSQENL